MTDRAKEIAIQLDYISTSILHTMADLYDYPNLHTTNVYKLKNALKYVIDNNTDTDIPKSYLDLIEEAMKIYNSLYNIHPPQQYNIHQIATAITEKINSKKIAEDIYSNLMDINNKPKTATRSTVKDNVQKMLLKDSLRKGKK